MVDDGGRTKARRIQRSLLTKVFQVGGGPAALSAKEKSVIKKPGDMGRREGL